MGAHTIETVLSGTLGWADVQREFAKWQAEDRHEYGQNPYNGSWSTMRGLRQGPLDLADADAARAYYEAHAEKWGNAIAVKYTHVTRTPTATPTFEGKAHKPLNGIDEPEPVVIKVYPRGGMEYRLVAADQVPAASKQPLLDLYAETLRLELAARGADHALRTALNDIAVLADAKIDGKALRALHRDKFSSMARAAASREKWRAKSDALRARLYQYTEERKPRWMVGGWAAS